MDDSPDFRVRLPENCSIEDVIEIVNDLPTVPSNDAGLDGRLLFKPPTDNPIIDFDLRRTTRITPEACGALFALIEWLGAHAATTVTVQLPATSFKAVVFKKLLLQPVDATTDPSASVTPIANIAQQLGDEMLDELNVAPHAQCREWLKFALYETLLNVAQHSKLATDNDVSAYVAVSIDSGAPANNVPRKSGATSPATDAAEKWLRKTEQWNKWKLWASRWTDDGLASRSYR